jgi:hypothetical protein
MQCGTRYANTTTWRCERCDPIFNFLRLYSVNPCPKITQLFWYEFIKTYLFIKRNVLDISPVFRMRTLQDADIDNVLFWINTVDKCTRSFPRCYVNRGKSGICIIIDGAASGVTKRRRVTVAYSIRLYSFLSFGWK